MERNLLKDTNALRKAHVFKRDNVSIKQLVTLFFNSIQLVFCVPDRAQDTVGQHFLNWPERTSQVPDILLVNCMLLDCSSFWCLILKHVTTHPNHDDPAWLIGAVLCQNEMTGWPTAKMAFACMAAYLIGVHNNLWPGCTIEIYFTRLTSVVWISKLKMVWKFGKR